MNKKNCDPNIVQELSRLNKTLTNQPFYNIYYNMFDLNTNQPKQEEKKATVNADLTS